MRGRHWPHLPVRDGTLQIAVGLVALTASAYVPALPVLSAMALVAAGATAALCTRLAYSQHAALAIAAHLCVYVSLYSIFVGAVIHEALSGAQKGIAGLWMIDFGASVVLIAMALRKAVGTILGSAAF